MPSHSRCSSLKPLRLDHEIARGDGVGVDDRVLGQRVLLPLEHRQPVEPLERLLAPICATARLQRPGQVGYGEGYYEVFARGWSGARRPVDCRIVRRSSPIINLVFTPCTLKKEISDLCRRSRGFIRASPNRSVARLTSAGQSVPVCFIFSPLSLSGAGARRRLFLIL